MASVIGRLLTFALVVGVAGSCNPTTEAPQPAPPTPSGQGAASDRDQTLSREVQAFLESWLIKRDAQGAVRGRASQVFPDERFVPSEWFDPAEYRKRFPASRMNVEARIQPQEFQDRLAQYVESLTDTSEPEPQAAARTGGLITLLLPFAPEQVRAVYPDLYGLIAADALRALPVAGIPSLAYPVQAWDDISWTQTGTIGYRAALGQQSRQKGVDIQAVVCRLRPDSADEPAALVVTLWSDEGTKGTTWRLLGLVLPPVK